MNMFILRKKAIFKQQVFYKPQQNAAEMKLLERLKAWWKKKY